MVPTFIADGEILPSGTCITVHTPHGFVLVLILLCPNAHSERSGWLGVSQIYYVMCKLLYVS
jgi:hypothetical protein